MPSQRRTPVVLPPVPGRGPSGIPPLDRETKVTLARLVRQMEVHIVRVSAAINELEPGPLRDACDAHKLRLVGSAATFKLLCDDVEAEKLRVTFLRGRFLMARRD